MVTRPAYRRCAFGRGRARSPGLRRGLWMRGAALCLALGLTATASAAAAADPHKPLRDVPKIDNSMLWVGIAIEIGKKCDSIDPRTVKGLLYLNGLKNEALSMGYSAGEIKDYVTSKTEKARIRKRGEQYVKSQGLDPDKPADLCTLGTREIARNSQIGVLLREK